MHQLVYVFGKEPLQQLEKFSGHALYFHDWPVKDVLEHLRMRGKLKASFEMMETLNEHALIQLITNQVVENTRVMLTGDELRGEQFQLAQELGIGVIINIDKDGTTRWVSHWTNENWRLDWAIIGGRWNAFLQPKPGVKPALYPNEDSGWLMHGAISRAMEPAWSSTPLNTNFIAELLNKPVAPFPVEDGRNILQKSEVDFEAMKIAGRKGRAELWHSIRKIVRLENFLDLRTLLSVEQDLDAFHVHEQQLTEGSTPEAIRRLAVDEYKRWPGAMEALQTLRDWHKDLSGYSVTDDIIKFSEELEMIVMLELNQYLDLKGFEAYLPNSFVIDGEWRTQDAYLDIAGKDRFGLDRLRMWADEFHDIYDQLPDDTLVTVTDCHY